MIAMGMGDGGMGMNVASLIDKNARIYFLP
jgi:hypothetical protein